MPKSKTRKNVDENFKVAAVQRLQTGGVPANDLAKELGVSIWSLRRWSREYRKRTATGAGAAGKPAASKELPTKPSSEPPVGPNMRSGIERLNPRTAMRGVLPRSLSRTSETLCDSVEQHIF